MRKTGFAALFTALLAVLIDRIYALFGHGVGSLSMDFMFLYPLAGGCAVFFLLSFAAPALASFRGYRFFYNMYFTGVALLTVRALLKGVFDIAGTASSLLAWYSVAGWCLAAIPACAALAAFASRRRGKKEVRLKVSSHYFKFPSSNLHKNDTAFP